MSLNCPALAGGFFTISATREAHVKRTPNLKIERERERMGRKKGKVRYFEQWLSQSERKTHFQFYTTVLFSYHF